MSRILLCRQLALGITAPLIFAFALIPCAHAAVTQYAIDPAHTVVTFETRNIGFLTHRGRFSGASGTVELDPRAGAGRMEILVDARTLEAKSAVMERFLRSENLLDVEQHPRIAYMARHIVYADGAPQRIEGELTLRGVTQPVALVITGNDCVGRTASVAGQRCSMAATATFRRSAFGMTAYGAFASDEVKLVVRAVGVRMR